MDSNEYIKNFFIHVPKMNRNVYDFGVKEGLVIDERIVIFA